MPDTPSTPGHEAYNAWLLVMVTSRDLPLWHDLSPQEWFAWDAAAQAVLVADSDGRHMTTALFRYAIGDMLRLGTLGPWTVRSRRWVEREVMPPYAEYWVELAPGGTRAWEVEADLEPWEEEQHG